MTAPFPLFFACISQWEVISTNKVIMCTNKRNSFPVTDVFKKSTHAGGRTLKLLKVQTENIMATVHPKFHCWLTYIKHSPLASFICLNPPFNM